MLSEEAGGGLLFVLFGVDRLEILGFEDLAAVEAFHVLDAVAAGNHLGPGVFANGKHKTALLMKNILSAHTFLSSPPGNVSFVRRALQSW
jgi:hypothetical protein